MVFSSTRQSRVGRDGHRFCERRTFLGINEIFRERWFRSEKKRTMDERRGAHREMKNPTVKKKLTI